MHLAVIVASWDPCRPIALRSAVSFRVSSLKRGDITHIERFPAVHEIDAENEPVEVAQLVGIGEARLGLRGKIRIDDMVGRGPAVVASGAAETAIS